MPANLDPRLHASDPSARVAEEALRGRVGDETWRFLRPRAGFAGPSRLSLRAQPDPLAAQVTEALPGEALEVLWENAEGWARLRTLHDGYLGWAQAADVLPQGALGQEVQVSALRAHAYAGPKVSQPILAELCLGAVLGRWPGEVVMDEQRRWCPVELPGGQAAWVQEVVLSPLQDADLGALAQRFLDTPYVWGGRSAWGLDCSGLTQLVYGAFGRAIPRDADQQRAFLNVVEEVKPGDLAFFPGHVGLILDGRRMIHANATHMCVTIETLGEGDYGERLQASCQGFGRWTA